MSDTTNPLKLIRAENVLIGEAWRDFGVRMSVGFWTRSEFGFRPSVGSSLFQREHDSGQREGHVVTAGAGRSTLVTHHSLHHSASPEHGSDSMKRRQELERIHFSAVNKFSQMFVRMARWPAGEEQMASKRPVPGGFRDGPKALLSETRVSQRQRVRNVPHRSTPALCPGGFLVGRSELLNLSGSG